MTPELLARIAAALAAGRATETSTLTALLLEAGGEQCWQRPRLLHRLSLILEAHQPRMATATTHRFKSAFAGKDFSGFPLVVGETTKMVTAHNLTDEDVPLLQQYGGGHLIEPIPTTGTEADVADIDRQIAELTAKRTSLTAQAAGQPAPGDVLTVNSGILQTATEQDGTTTVVKHSSGGPDDLPITAPAAAQADVATPEKKDEAQQPAKADAPDLHKLLKPALQAKYKEVLGTEPAESLHRDDLIKAIEAGPEKK